MCGDYTAEKNKNMALLDKENEVAWDSGDRLED